MKNTQTIEVGDMRVTFVKHPRLLLTVILGGSVDLATGERIDRTRFLFRDRAQVKPIPRVTFNVDFE